MLIRLTKLKISTPCWNVSKVIRSRRKCFVQWITDERYSSNKSLNLDSMSIFDFWIALTALFLDGPVFGGQRAPSFGGRLPGRNDECPAHPFESNLREGQYGHSLPGHVGRWILWSSPLLGACPDSRQQISVRSQCPEPYRLLMFFLNF